MTYCTTAELVNLSGSALATATLTAIIEQGDREIDAYLAPHGLSGAASGACKAASLHLAMAGLLDYGRLSGARPDSSTTVDISETVRIEEAVARYRRTAYALLDSHIAAVQSSAGGEQRYYVRRVNA